MLCFFNEKSNDDDWAEALRAALTIQKGTFTSATSASEYNSDGAARASKSGADLTCLRPATSMEPILHGTTKLIPCGLVRSIEEEFEGTEYWKEYHYVVHEEAREGGPIYEGKDPPRWSSDFVRDRGHDGWTLTDFVNLKKAQQANLTHAEVVSLRLYTSPWFANINLALRKGKDISDWATTTSVLISALFKLSLQNPPKRVYRAIKGVLSEETKIGSTHVDRGFLSCSDDTQVTTFYSGNPNIAAVILCVESNFSARPGNIGEIGQCPDENEFTLPPFTSLEILDTIQQGQKMLVHVRPTLCPMRHYTDRLRYPWSSPKDPLTWEEYDLIEDSLKDTSGFTSEQFRETKFSSSISDLLTGAPKTAALGLEAYMNQSLNLPSDGVAAIEKEINTYGTEMDKKWFRYIMYEPASHVEDDWGVRDVGHHGMDLESFYQHKNARIAGLTMGHVLALRLYTCRVYLSLNNPLRKFKRDQNGALIHPLSMEAPHRLPITIAFIDDGIRKLRAVDAVESQRKGIGPRQVILWRGMRDIKTSDEFLRSGGVEVAPMSTTYSLKTAIHYATKGEANTIFKIVTNSFMDRGANIAFLSTYPKEEEYLYPPLTFLSPTGRTQRIGSINVIELVPRL